MEKLLLFSHVAAGIAVLLLGLFIMIVKKGTRQHIIIGKTYVGFMWWICLSAVLSITLLRFSGFLLVIAVLTFYASFSGLRVMRRRRTGEGQLLDWIVAALTSAFGIGLVIYGLSVFFKVEAFSVFGLLCLIFGTFTAKAGIDDLQFFRNPDLSDKTWWIRQHISAMSGSYIAAITAFAVQNGNLFQLNDNFQWLLWVLPSIMGAPIVSLAIRKHTSRKSEAMPA